MKQTILVVIVLFNSQVIRIDRWNFPILKIHYTHSSLLVLYLTQTFIIFCIFTFGIVPYKYNCYIFLSILLLFDCTFSIIIWLFCFNCILIKFSSRISVWILYAFNHSVIELVYTQALSQFLFSTLSLVQLCSMQNKKTFK